MPNDKDSLVMSLTPEQEEREDAFCRQLAFLQAESVHTILAQGITPQTLLEVIENASWFAEDTAKKMKDPKTPPVACKEGCWWCCYQTIPVRACEVFRITRFLSNLAEETRISTMERLRKLDKKTRGYSAEKRTKLHLPCAFILDGRCSIYPVRPLACAEFTSFDIQDCKQGQRVGYRPFSIIHEKARMLAFYAVGEGLSLGLREVIQNADHSPLELTAAVLSALDSPNAEDLWITNRNVFARAHLTLHA